MIVAKAWVRNPPTAVGRKSVTGHGALTPRLHPKVHFSRVLLNPQEDYEVNDTVNDKRAPSAKTLKSAMFDIENRINTPA